MGNSVKSKLMAGLMVLVMTLQIRAQNTGRTAEQELDAIFSVVTSPDAPGIPEFNPPYTIER